MRLRLQPVLVLVLSAVLFGATSLSAQNGSLHGSDPTLPSGEYYDVHTFDGEIGDVVSIRLDSDEFDAYLILRSPSGRETENDDRTAETDNAGIEEELDENGRWTVIVTSYEPGETGEYQLEMNLGSSSSPSPVLSRVGGF